MPRAADRTRIARIHSVPLQGSSEEGSAYYAAESARRLHGAGVDLEVWTKRLARPAVPQPFPVVRCWRPGPFAWYGVLREIARRRPALIHVEHSMFMFGAGATSELSTLVVLATVAAARIPLVVTMHDVPRLAQITPQYIRLHKYRFSARIVRFGLRVVLRAIGAVADRVVVHHVSLAATLESDYGVPATKLAYVPLAPLPFELPTPESARRRLGHTPTDRIVLYFGFATGYKGIEPLLDAMSAMGAEPDAPVLVLGAGYHPKKQNNRDYERFYGALRRRAEAMANVRFVGFIADEELDDYVAACDVAIFPYVESQSMSGPLLQCLTRGRSALVSMPIARQLGISPDDAFDVTPAGIARAVERYFEDAAFRERIDGLAERLRAEALADAARATILDVYREAAAR